jgi:AraC family transcriptional regulator
MKTEFLEEVSGSYADRPQQLWTSHGEKKYPRSSLLVSSTGRNWRGIVAEKRFHAPTVTPRLSPTCLEVTLSLEGNSLAMLRRRGAGQYQESRVETGNICLSPVGIDDNEVTITDCLPSSLHIYLSPDVFCQLSYDYNIIGAAASSIRYLSDVKDRELRGICTLIYEELTHETSTGKMLIETAALMLAAKLLNSYADVTSIPFEKSVHPLNKARLKRALEFIEDNCHDLITLDDLATVASLSKFHFSRMFSATLGMSPQQYISKVRLERAKIQLTRKNASITQIACEAGFSSQASFTRAFKRVVGLSPGDYRAIKTR